MEDQLTLNQKIDSVRKAARYGVENDKRNMIVDLDVLIAVLGSGHQVFTIDELTERFYLASRYSRREELLGGAR